MNQSPPVSNRAVITLALGLPVYWKMAVNLARSIRRWHTNNDLPVTIVTDHAAVLPRDLAGVNILRVMPNELGIGFETKLHLDRLAPAPHTLFIDADCLVYARLDEAFNRFKGQPVSVIQDRLASEGHHFGDIANYCHYLGVAKLPVFTGGMYYLEPDKAGPVYELARDLRRHYDDIGLVRLRGLPNEELLVAGAMARHKLWGLPNDGSIIGDFQTSPGPHTLNVLAGHRRLCNPPAGSGRHHAASPVRTIEPAVVHFLAYYTHLPHYRADAAALACVAAGIPETLAAAVSRVFILLPGLLMERLKDAFRPLFRKFFGARPVVKTDRMTA